MAAKPAGSVQLPSTITPTAEGIQTYLVWMFQMLNRLLQAIYTRLNICLPEDGSERMTAPLPLAQYNGTSSIAPGGFTGCIIYDTSAGKLRYSTGSTWTSL